MGSRSGNSWREEEYTRTDRDGTSTRWGLRLEAGRGVAVGCAVSDDALDTTATTTRNIGWGEWVDGWVNGEGEGGTPGSPAADSDDVHAV